MESVVITGIGAIASCGRDADEFAAALREGRSGVSALPPGMVTRVGAVLGEPAWEAYFEQLAESGAESGRRARKLLRNTPGATRLAAMAASMAWRDARAAGAHPPESVGLVVAGSNLHQRWTHEAHEQFRARGTVNPRHGLALWDTHQVGTISELLDLRGCGCSFGGASASGNVALFNALLWLRAGAVDACLVVGAAPELSALELTGLSQLGALHSGEDVASGASTPGEACRPFDLGHAGFVFGEGAAALFLETENSARRRGVPPLARLAGASCVLAGSHLPTPSHEGEVRAMRRALADAGLGAADVDYVNAHATGSPAGDITEAAALREVFLGCAPDASASPAAASPVGGPWINATKALTGHTLGAAGLLEAVACVVQMRDGFLHGNINLARPVPAGAGLRWTGPRGETARVDRVLSNSFGFGGIHSSIVLQRVATPA